jgi:methionyl-tRNA formyltransferase
MGTPEFAVPSLEAIHSEFGISAVVTVPDKPQGRGQKVIPSPIKSKALKFNIPVLQPMKLKDEEFIEQIKSINPDIIVVIAFRILPKEVYTLAKIASFNIHGSLLPKYRGAAPINWAIIKGENKTGLTSFILKDTVDTGDILLIKEVEIEKSMNFGNLHDLLMPQAAELSIETINLLLSGHYSPKNQNDTESCPAPKLNKDNTKINWNNSSEDIINFVRGLSPHPTAWTTMNSNPLKIIEVNYFPSVKLEPGKFEITSKKFLIGTLNGSIECLRLQPQNKNAMNVADFINGYRGEKTGELV